MSGARSRMSVFDVSSLAATRGLDVALRLRAWPLELVNDEPLDADLIADEVAALRAHVAPDLFAGFDPQHFPKTSLPALALSAGADEFRTEIAERVGLALRWALFEEGRDLATPEVLLDIAAAAGIGLPVNDAQQQIRDDWAEGDRRGVIGSPHFFVGPDGYFCPTLNISRTDGQLTITDNSPAFEAFVGHALGQ